jgi:hypothetical protein
MTTKEKALLTYQIIQKKKQRKQDQERQINQDKGYIGWNGYQKFVNRELKRYY